MSPNGSKESDVPESATGTVQMKATVRSVGTTGACGPHDNGTQEVIPPNVASEASRNIKSASTKSKKKKEDIIAVDEDPLTYSQKDLKYRRMYADFERLERNNLASSHAYCPDRTAMFSIQEQKAKSKEKLLSKLRSAVVTLHQIPKKAEEVTDLELLPSIKELSYDGLSEVNIPAYREVAPALPGKKLPRVRSKLAKSWPPQSDDTQLMTPNFASRKRGRPKDQMATSAARDAKEGSAPTPPAAKKLKASPGTGHGVKKGSSGSQAKLSQGKQSFKHPQVKTTLFVPAGWAPTGSKIDELAFMIASLSGPTLHLLKKLLPHVSSNRALSLQALLGSACRGMFLDTQGAALISGGVPNHWSMTETTGRVICETHGCMHCGQQDDGMPMRTCMTCSQKFHPNCFSQGVLLTSNQTTLCPKCQGYRGMLGDTWHTDHICKVALMPANSTGLGASYSGRMSRDSSATVQDQAVSKGADSQSQQWMQQHPPNMQGSVSGSLAPVSHRSGPMNKVSSRAAQLASYIHSNTPGIDAKMHQTSTVPTNSVTSVHEAAELHNLPRNTTQHHNIGQQIEATVSSGIQILNSVGSWGNKLENSHASYASSNGPQTARSLQFQNGNQMSQHAWQNRPIGGRPPGAPYTRPFTNGRPSQQGLHETPNHISVSSSLPSFEHKPALANARPLHQQGNQYLSTACRLYFNHVYKHMFQKDQSGIFQLTTSIAAEDITKTIGPFRPRGVDGSWLDIECMAAIVNRVNSIAAYAEQCGWDNGMWQLSDFRAGQAVVLQVPNNKDSIFEAVLAASPSPALPTTKETARKVLSAKNTGDYLSAIAQWAVKLLAVADDAVHFWVAQTRMPLCNPLNQYNAVNLLFLASERIRLAKIAKKKRAMAKNKLGISSHLKQKSTNHGLASSGSTVIGKDGNMLLSTSQAEGQGPNDPLPENRTIVDIDEEYLPKETSFKSCLDSMKLYSELPPLDNPQGWYIYQVNGSCFNIKAIQENIGLLPLNAKAGDSLEPGAGIIFFRTQYSPGIIGSGVVVGDLTYETMDMEYMKYMKSARIKNQIEKLSWRTYVKMVDMYHDVISIEELESYPVFKELSVLQNQRLGLHRLSPADAAKLRELIGIHIQPCMACGSVDDTAENNPMVMCDGCNASCHIQCARPPLKAVPSCDWFCQDCKTKKNSRKKVKKATSTPLSRRKKQRVVTPDSAAKRLIPRRNAASIYASPRSEAALALTDEEVINKDLKNPKIRFVFSSNTQDSGNIDKQLHSTASKQDEHHGQATDSAHHGRKRRRLALTKHVNTASKLKSEPSNAEKQKCPSSETTSCASPENTGQLDKSIPSCQQSQGPDQDKDTLTCSQPSTAPKGSKAVKKVGRKRGRKRAQPADCRMSTEIGHAADNSAVSLTDTDQTAISPNPATTNTQARRVTRASVSSGTSAMSKLEEAGTVSPTSSSRGNLEQESTVKSNNRPSTNLAKKLVRKVEVSAVSPKVSDAASVSGNVDNDEIQLCQNEDKHGSMHTNPTQTTGNEQSPAMSPKCPPSSTDQPRISDTIDNVGLSHQPETESAQILKDQPHTPILEILEDLSKRSNSKKADPAVPIGEFTGAGVNKTCNSQKSEKSSVTHVNQDQDKLVEANPSEAHKMDIVDLAPLITEDEQINLSQMKTKEAKELAGPSKESTAFGVEQAESGNRRALVTSVLNESASGKELAANTKAEDASEENGAKSFQKPIPCEQRANTNTEIRHQTTASNNNEASSATLDDSRPVAKEGDHAQSKDTASLPTESVNCSKSSVDASENASSATVKPNSETQGTTCDDQTQVTTGDGVAKQPGDDLHMNKTGSCSQANDVVGDSNAKTTAKSVNGTGAAQEKLASKKKKRPAAVNMNGKAVAKEANEEPARSCPRIQRPSLPEEHRRLVPLRRTAMLLHEGVALIAEIERAFIEQQVVPEVVSAVDKESKDIIQWQSATCLQTTRRATFAMVLRMVYWATVDGMGLPTLHNQFRQHGLKRNDVSQQRPYPPSDR